MADKDVTAKAADMAGLVASRVVSVLKEQLFTGPDRVRLSQAEVQQQLELGNVDVVRETMKSMDEAQLGRLTR